MPSTPGVSSIGCCIFHEFKSNTAIFPPPVPLKVVRTLEVDRGSSEILVRPDGGIAYVSGTGGGKIAVLDLHSWTMQPPIDLTPGVDGMAWAAASH